MNHFAKLEGGRVVSPHLSLSHGRPRPHQALVQATTRDVSVGRVASRGSGFSGQPSLGYCPNHRWTSLLNRELRVAIAAPCGGWSCGYCGRRKARKVAKRFADMRPNVLMTFSLPRSAWPTRENAIEMQQKWRSFRRFLQRHKLIESYGWVPEEGAPRPECVCDPSLNGCLCGANGRQLHRHYLLRVPFRRGFRPGWLPWRQLQAVAKRLGLGTLDFRVIDDPVAAARYVSKYLFKAAGAAVGGSSRRFTITEPPPPPSAGWEWIAARVATVAVDLLGAITVDWDALRWEPSG